MDWLILNITVLLLTIIYVFLSFYVIKQRRRTKTPLGNNGEDHCLTVAIQAHSNFSNYTPFMLLLLLILTLESLPLVWLMFLCLIFVIGRCLHVYSMLVVEKRSPISFKYRIIGMQFTFFTLMMASISSLIWTLFDFIY